MRTHIEQEAGERAAVIEESPEDQSMNAIALEEEEAAFAEYVAS
jgi:hypothetical protein